MIPDSMSEIALKMSSTSSVIQFFLKDSRNRPITGIMQSRYDQRRLTGSVPCMTLAIQEPFAPPPA
jgi:hypothetical protein